MYAVRSALSNTDLAVVNTFTSLTAATSAALALSTDAAADAYPLSLITVTDLTSSTDLITINQLAVHASLYL